MVTARTGFLVLGSLSRHPLVNESMMLPLVSSSSVPKSKSVSDCGSVAVVISIGRSESSMASVMEATIFVVHDWIDKLTALKFVKDSES